MRPEPYGLQDVFTWAAHHRRDWLSYGMALMNLPACEGSATLTVEDEARVAVLRKLARTRRPPTLKVNEQDASVANLTSLLSRTATGDRAAFKALYDATSAKLFGTIIVIVIDRDEAEEILQEAYVKIWNKAATYDSTRGRPMTWLITIARYRAIDRLRLRPRYVTVDIEQMAQLSDSLPGADVLLFASRDAQRMIAAMAILPAHVAAAIRSAYFDGISNDAIAAREGVPVPTMKSWVRRGLLQLRAKLIADAEQDTAIPSQTSCHPSLSG